VLWARRYFDEIAQLGGDAGAKSLMRLHAADVHAVEAASDAPLSDIDTPQNLQAAMPGA
jgi:molybdenum cofactor cytidylyltransferase